MNRDNGVYFDTRHASWAVVAVCAGLLIAWLVGFWYGKHCAHALLVPYFESVAKPLSTHSQQAFVDAPMSESWFYACVASCMSYAQALQLCARAQLTACPLRIVKTSFILKNNRPFMCYQVLTVGYPTKQALDDALIALNNTIPGVRFAVIQRYSD